MHNGYMLSLLLNNMSPRRRVDREDQVGEENQLPPPPPDLQAHMLAVMNHFFAQCAGNNAEVGRRTRPEAVYERFHKMDPKDFMGTMIRWWPKDGLSPSR